MGHVGDNKWMPVSNGFKNKSQAQKWAKSQDKVDIVARGGISTEGTFQHTQRETV